MMKYLAILKDSLREALDSKVIYFTFGLSCIAILGVASISYRPQPADKALQSIVQQFSGARTSLMQGQASLRYDLQDFQPLDDANKPWEGTYRFSLTVKEQEPQALAALVWLDSMQRDEKELNEEDRDARKRLRQLAQQAQNLSPQQLNQLLTEGMLKEISQVTAARKERFIVNQFAMHGSLEASQVKFKPGADGKSAFAVEARPKEGVFRTWPHKLTFFFGAVPSEMERPIGPLIFEVQQVLVGSIGAGVTMLLSTVITAFFIPNMLRKGTIDLLLAKPIRRSMLLIYKFIGGLSFMFVNTVFVVTGMWLVLGMRSGLWAPSFLLTVFILTFEFAIFYAVSTLFGVVTRSVIVSILAACFSWFVLWGFGWFYVVAESTRPFEVMPSWLYTTADVLHFVLPHYKDLDLLAEHMLANELLGPESMEKKMMDKIYGKIKWDETIGVTTAFIALMLGLSCWWFAKRDY